LKLIGGLEAGHIQDGVSGQPKFVLLRACEFGGEADRESRDQDVPEIPTTRRPVAWCTYPQHPSDKVEEKSNAIND